MGSLRTRTPTTRGSVPSGISGGIASPAHIPLSSRSMPDFSSASEDKFYDAGVASNTPLKKHFVDNLGPPVTRPVSSKGDATKRPGAGESLKSSAPAADAKCDFPFDDTDDAGEDEAVEVPTSVITHLLSQVRLDMDLSKVALPTFILERRSLLEMYADFFAHPDLFVGITEQPGPRERMVEVVKFYLSAFHAGRKSSVAKKPYNPILGEVFYCHWDLPREAEVSARPADTVSDGPLPWSTSPNSVCFVAEQVSHHPPVSAFYAECYGKKMQFNAHIWTKSKFLGTSIGVHNVGQGCVSCLEHDEHYVLTFPSGYGRSILLVPWLELGGECKISCSKSGYSANVVFHTKPFLGSKKHRITAEIFAPNDKKPFCSVKGEWNGVMSATWASGENTLFIDTKKMEIVKKKVRKVEHQQEHESRCLWKDVTLNLKLKHTDAATEAKQRLEEKQRADAQERVQNEQLWETRHFHKVGESWVYDGALLKRLACERH